MYHGIEFKSSEINLKTGIFANLYPPISIFTVNQANAIIELPYLFVFFYRYKNCVGIYQKRCSAFAIGIENLLTLSN